jgi:ABC-2 type transport system permease protein
MTGVLTVFQREMSSYFSSTFAYLIAFALLVITGILFILDLDSAVDLRPPDPSVIPTFLSFAMIFFAPLLTMRLLAEEKREGTLELLLTSPASDTGIVVGKFLGAWGYYSLLLAITFIYQLLVASVTQHDISHAIAAYMGIWLYGGACLSVGMAFSALTENQIVAAFLSSAVLFLLWIGDRVGLIINNTDVARVIRELTLQGHFSTSFAYGLLRTEDVVFFAGMITVMLYVTIQLVQSNRWR